MFESTDGFVSFFFHLLELLSQNEIILFVASLWSIWKRQDQKIWENIDAYPTVSFQLARDVIHNWQAVCNARRRQQQQQQHIRANLQMSNDGNGAGIGAGLVQEQ
ncbi:hypothetical protein QL285_013749 [Trifolium repens]|nr:hypothetical protein QL285_013749 [Trifolium repens]